MSERLEQQFKHRANELRRSPRPQAWQRLERRLDDRAQRWRIGWYRLMWIAASVLLLVGVTWTLTQSAYAVEQNPLATLTDSGRSRTLAPVSQAAEATYRERARINYDSPIVEGDRDKQLVVVAPDGRKQLPTIAPAPTRARIERVSRLRVRPADEWQQ